MLDVNQYYPTARIDVTRCPHCKKKFRITAQRDGRRISPLLFEGQAACCPACRKNFVIKIIPDKAQARRHTQQLAREFDRLVPDKPASSRESTTNGVSFKSTNERSPLPPSRSLAPVHPTGTLARADKPLVVVPLLATNSNVWSSYNPQPIRLTTDSATASSLHTQPTHFSWAAWGCGTVVLGFVLYLPFAVVLMAILGPDIGWPIGLISGFLFAPILCYRMEKDAPARDAKRAQVRRQRDAKRKAAGGENRLERWLRERAEYRRTHPELSYDAYLA